MHIRRAAARLPILGFLVGGREVGLGLRIMHVLTVPWEVGLVAAEGQCRAGMGLTLGWTGAQLLYRYSAPRASTSHTLHIPAGLLVWQKLLWVQGCTLGPPQSAEAYGPAQGSRLLHVQDGAARAAARGS